MARTWAQIKALSAQKLQDTGMAVYLTAELDQYLTEALMELSHVLPRYVKYTLTTGTSTRDITLTTEQMRNAVCYGLQHDPHVEYPISQSPITKVNFTRTGSTISLLYNNYPTASASAYLWIGKKHILPAVVLTDLAGDVQTTAALGASSVAVHALGTESYVPQDTTFTVAGDATVYTVTQDCTIATNAATLVFTPVLAAEATQDAVVTLVNPVSTLEFAHEELVASLVAGLAMKYKAAAAYNTVNTAVTDITSLSTAIGLVAARVAQAVTDLASGRTEAAKIDELVAAANAEILLINSQVDLAVTDLSTARALLGSIDNANQLAHGVGLANGQVNAAQGFLASANGLLAQARGTEGNAATLFSEASHELSAASARIAEANAWGSKASREAQISNAGRTLQAAGEGLIAETQRKIRRLAPARTYTQYAES
jgi:hypothetical protein